MVFVKNFVAAGAPYFQGGGQLIAQKWLAMFPGNHHLIMSYPNSDFSKRDRNVAHPPAVNPAVGCILE